MLPQDCQAELGPPSASPCGYDRRSRRLRHCCEAASAPSPRTAALSEDCGRGGPRITGRNLFFNIANGRPAERSTWPWVALLGTRQHTNGTVDWACGGTLIGPRHVLTAAHCVHIDLERMVVRLGEHDRTTSEDGEHQDRAVRRAARHPDRNRSRNDLALLELDRPVQLGAGVQPICLPDPAETLVGRIGWVVGWGVLRFHDRTAANVLQEAIASVEPADECEEIFRQTPQYSFRFPGGFGGNVLCATDPHHRGMDACQGDSGGPLAIQRPDGRYQLAGLVLAGVSCGNSDFPGLYTRVASYIDWIRSEVARS
ncbi:venom protease-like [Pollicipes pollicipes]|uniref:venom protease-like n=1 Tax=Pollicipes pollicipes TaxID=41117 RepID=UPI001884B333|nr:venom protease-like [Pollicipes pollicipes]